MVHKLMAAGVCLALAVIAGCSDGDDDQPSESTATLTVATATADQRTPRPTALPTPPRTGIASIDAAIEAIQHQDSDALIAQMRLSLIPCEAAPMGLSPFPACDGAPEGSLFERFPVSRCEGFFASRDSAEQTIRDFVTSTSSTVQVHAVFNTGGSRLDGGLYARAEPRYMVVLRAPVEDSIAGGGLLLDDEGVVGYSGACGFSPAGFIAAWELTDAIIPPPDER